MSYNIQLCFINPKTLFLKRNYVVQASPRFSPPALISLVLLWECGTTPGKTHFLFLILQPMRSRHFLYLKGVCAYMGCVAVCVQVHMCMQRSQQVIRGLTLSLSAAVP